MARRLYQAAIVMGVMSVAAYVYMIENVGGFVEAYSRVKGGGRAPSGYIGEAILLSFPAVLFGALARRAAGRVRPGDVMLAILIMSPHLIQGTFGGRRGPLFLALTVLFFAWLIARGGFPSFRKVVVGVAIIGLSVILVWSQRQDVYLGSEGTVEIHRFWDIMGPEYVEPGDTYVFSAAKILEADFYQSYYWGYRYFVTFFIRPIPRQLWPTKYEDMGATWIIGIDDHAQAASLIRAVGFATPAGAALPSIADVYLEFSWGVLPFFLVLGRILARIWSLHRERGGVWSVIHCIMLALSIYLATQSFSAWAHRLLFIGGPTVALWSLWITRDSAAPSRAIPRETHNLVF
jgi:oligosaccharide repeat unit polymerase